MTAPQTLRAQVKPHNRSSESVVEITCPVTEGGRQKQMRATGFAWHHPRYVVTALHAVVGCEDLPYVKSDAMGDGSPAEVVRAYLEADLALLELNRDLGLTELENASSMPDVEGRFYLYGYPLYAKSMNGSSVALKWGLGGEAVTLLGKTFKSSELDDLFAQQDYPTPQTRIIGLKDPIVSGFSGSPIFDEAGRVVAIVDGALLKGFVGANWGVPAHLYLPGLLESEDRAPSEVSSWAKQILKSSVSELDVRNVPIGLPTAGNGDSSRPAVLVPSNLSLARRISLKEIGDYVDDYAQDSYATNLNNLEIFLEDRAQVDALEFRIYEEAETGATFGLPAAFAPSWNEDAQVIQAFTESGAVAVEVAIERWGSFEDAIGEGKQSFIDYIAALGTWNDGKSPADFDLVSCVREEGTGTCDPDFKWRQNSDVFNGVDPQTGTPIELTLTVTVSDSDLLAIAIYNYGEFNEDLTEEDKISYLELQTGLNLLTDFSRH